MKLFQRIIFSVVLIALVSLIVPAPARAIVVPTTDPATAAISAQIVKHEIKATVGARMLGSAVVGLINAVTKFAQQFAFDLANGLASGAAGQNPLAFLDNPKEYAKKSAFDAAGEFIGNLSGPWEELGLNLCTPRIPEIGIGIQLGLVTQMGQRPAPKCDFGNFLNNWSQISREVQDPNALLNKISLAFDATQTDLGQAFRAQEALRFQVAERKHALDIAKLEGKGILPKLGLISGKVETPSAVIEENFREVAKSGKDNTLKAGDVIGASLGSPDVWVGAAGAVWNTFVNTLISKSLNLALQGLFKPGEEALPDLTKFIGGAPPKAGGATLNPAAVALLTPQIRTSESSLEYLSDLATCPSRELATQFQCTIDQKFSAALQLGRSGSALTVAEAVDPKNGYLDRAKPFGFINPATGQEPDYTLGYPYSSMKKLRLLRIIPVGWEFAALKAKALGKPVTLGDVLDGWNNAGSDFFGLVDPNWVLKAPTATCGAFTWSAVLDGSGTSRQESCADLKHCVAEDSLGTCKAYGYCTRERNTWDFDGDACEAQFASCDTFQSSAGNELSLLENTVEFGSCDAGNAGCTQYLEHQTPDSAGKFNWDNTEKIFIDRDAQTCTQKDDGCTEFIAPTAEVEVVVAKLKNNPKDKTLQYPGDAVKSYYRAPPDYLGCTGEEGEPEKCRDGQYARVCRKDEAGCAEYRPANGDPSLPAVASALDRCPQECAGYNTYIKQSSTFEPQFSAQGEGLYLIIPQRSQACDAAASGCEEFTNLANEQRQYFTSLRSCQKPSPDDQTYFTWEGSDTTGYQLKSWVLKRSNAGAVGGGDVDVITQAPATPPCTNYALDQGGAQGFTTVTCTDAIVNQAVCDPGVGDSDCRSFYDERGNIFYRQFSRTIVSTEECTSYRWSGLTTLPEVPNADRAVLEEAACTHGHGFWNATTKQCLYLGAPTLSNSCAAQSKGCRGFSGNAGANVQVALTESFESGIGGWTGGTLSSEALQVQQHSLKVVGDSASRTVNDEFAAGKTFLVNFLAKGAVNTELTELEVKIGEKSLGKVKLTPSWQTVTLGPVAATVVNPLLAFTRTAGPGPFFIDEVILKAVVDTVYLVKNSWDIPLSCDTLPPEVGGGLSRGAMLGCAEYRNSAGVTDYFKSFSNLCRPQAVGCQDLIDTRNSEAPFEETFDQGNSDAVDDVKVEADRHRYLVVSPQVACQAAQKGCQGLGARTDQGTFNTVYRKNDPSRYSTDLCTIEDEGCDSWSRKDKSVAYFKAPTGGACEWRSSVTVGVATYSGWFRKDKQPVVDPSPLASLPTVDASPLTSTTNTNKLIDSKQECQGYGKWQSTSCVNAQGNSIEGIAGCAPGLCGQSGQNACTDCANICNRGVGGTWNNQTSKCEADAPCYGSVYVVGNEALPMLSVANSQSYITAGNSFGIWRNADPGYAQGRRIGLCPEDQATCTEFRDPTDKTSPDDPTDPGRAYYFKDNERLKEARAACSGTVSRKAGCVLFDNTEVLAKQWDAQESYAKSEAAGGAKVNPESGATNNVNTILKVRRDRSCAEWYQCASAQWVWDEQKNQFRSVCHQQALCNELAPTLVAQGAHGYCIGPVNLTRRDDGNPFNLDQYLARDRKFSGQEYVGYSIPNLYPLGLLEEKETTAGFNLAYKIDSNTFQAPDGSANFSTTPGLPNFWSTSCRGYPEPNSPFPSTTDVQNAYKNAPKCSMVNGEYKCECSYKALDYGGTARYFEQDFDKAPVGICVSGTGTTKTACESGGGSWQPQSGEANAIGWLGYCLERDESRIINASKDARACLTWWPVDRIKAAPDVYNQFAEAGYTFQQGYGRYFCLLGSGVSTINESKLGTNLTGSNAVRAQNGFLVVKDITIQEKIYKGDIKEFIVEVASEGGAEGQINVGAAVNTYVIPIDKETDPNQDIALDPAYNNQCDAGSFTDNSDDSGSSCWGYSTIVNPDPDDPFQGYWWWVGDDNSRHDCVDLNGSGGNFTAGECDGNGDDEGRGTAPGSPLAHQLALQVLSANPKQPGPACSPYDNSYDGVAVLLHFTPPESEDPGRLDKIRIGACAGTAGPIDADPNTEPTTGGYAPQLKVRFNLHPYCEYLYKVDSKPGSSRSAPNTTTLSSVGEVAFSTNQTYGTANQPYYPPSKRYTYDTLHVGPAVLGTAKINGSTTSFPLRFVPFGSASQNTNVHPDEYTHPWFLNFNRTEDPQGKGVSAVPFAGWPYGCRAPQDCTIDSRLSFGGSSVTAKIEKPFVVENVGIPPGSGNPPTTVLNAPITPQEAVAADKFGKLFAKRHLESVFVWDPQLHRYVANFDFSWNYTANGQAPIIAAPTFTPPCEGGICQDPVPSGGITLADLSPFAINGISGQNQYAPGYNGYLLATAQFHAWARDSQMPLRKITVDWDDGFVESGEGLYRNHRGLKSSGASQCDNSTAGRMAEKSCKTAYYTYDHRYACRKGDLKWQEDCGVEGFPNGCCKFTPKIQVQDNWKLCNGNDCSEGGGQKFWGTIVVGPKQ